MKVICCLTSYPTRIFNCRKVIQSLLDNTVKPDKIYLTLCYKQFPHGVMSLPYDLLDLVNSEPNFIVNWVEEDTKIMKKVIPVLKYLDDDDIIFCCDDDILYPQDYIESRLNDFNRFSCSPLTGCIKQDNRTLYKELGIPCSIGFSCVFQKKHIAGIDKFVNSEVIQSNNDDCSYSVVEWLNGYVAHDVTKYWMEWLDQNCKYNEVNPSRLNGSYKRKGEVIRLLRKRVYQVYGI